MNQNDIDSDGLVITHKSKEDIGIQINKFMYFFLMSSTKAEDKDH